MNGAILDPEDHVLMISAEIEDITIHSDGNERVLISVVNLIDGIEVLHDDDRLWWPV